MDDMNRELSHLPLPFIFKGRPKLNGGGKKPPQEQANASDRNGHANGLSRSVSNANSYWANLRQSREAIGLPQLPPSIPIILRVEPGSDLDYLRSTFDFEIVAEHEDGFVIVCSENLDLTDFLRKIDGFKSEVRGTGNVAKIYEFFGPDNSQQRLKNILDVGLYEKWASIDETKIYVFDVSIECLGTVSIPKPPTHKGEDDTNYPKRYERWVEKRNNALSMLDDLQLERETAVMRFVEAYKGECLSITQEGRDGDSSLPDSFVMRIQVSGACLKDIVINYPYVFEVSEPDDIESYSCDGAASDQEFQDLVIKSPESDAPYICVIDSGIQENHKLLQPFVDAASSHCFIPTENGSDVADYVRPGGHGTRVAGAIAYGNQIPRSGEFQGQYWIRNARVLDSNNALQSRMLPPALLTSIVDKYTKNTDRPSKIYNHSINSTAPFSGSRMSAWAAEIDNLSWKNDILFVQSAGNIDGNNDHPRKRGICNHLSSGKDYPQYLLSASSRISNPAQSMHAITVGSISSEKLQESHLNTFAEVDNPSTFSRTGLGMWGAVKPDVVEYGGDYSLYNKVPPQIRLVPEGCPELIRSTLDGGGSIVAQDNVGTSFAAPKVTRIAAHIQNVFPDEPASLYRSLIGLSARWPQWAEGAENKSDIIRMLGYGIPSLERALFSSDKRVSLISSGFNYISDREGHIWHIPIPEVFRAPGNDFDVRIDVCLSYTAPTRRTRRHPRNYFGTWVEWKSSKYGENLDSFKSRLFHDQVDMVESDEDVISWKLRERSDWGEIGGTSRSKGTLQKDWVVMPAHKLPEDFCLAVIGHAGWDYTSEFGAKYSLAISIEALDANLNIYELIEVELDTMEIETEVLS